MTMTPRGTTYVTIGSHGFYYRETLSHNQRLRSGGAPSGLVPRAPTRTGDEIRTADVSDLVDSSSAKLIERLNERARMFNPAWIMYLAAIVMLLWAFGAFSAASSSNLPAFPEVASASEVNSSGVGDPYSALVVRYGYPDLVVSSLLRNAVPIRTARYLSARLDVVFVPNGCVLAYNLAHQSTVGASRYSAVAKQEAKNIKPCVPSTPGAWTMAGFVDSAEQRDIPSSMARERLESMSSKQTAPPLVKAQNATSKRNPRSRTIIPDPQAPAQTWTMQDQVKIKAVSSNDFYSGVVSLICGLGFFISGIVVQRWNTEKRTSRLFYELNEAEQQKFSIVKEAFTQLSKSQQIWRIEANSATSDWKRNAGASSIVRRVKVTLGLANPPRVQTNIPVPCLDIRSAKLFFFPDVILYFERGTFGGIAYSDIHIEQQFTRFIEDGQVPGDARIVDNTWRYVNKNGGPDRRFNNNAQLPVAQYGVLVLTSSRGLNIHLNTSNADASLAFANCWRALRTKMGIADGTQAEAPKIRETSPSNPDEQAFRILGLNRDASTSEISAAYHRLAQMYHPDKVVGLAPEFQILADQRMKEINAAYAALKQ